MIEMNAKMPAVTTGDEVDTCIQEEVVMEDDDDNVSRFIGEDTSKCCFAYFQTCPQVLHWRYVKELMK